MIQATDSAAGRRGVLLVEADPDLSGEIAEGLLADGFEVRIAATAAEAAALLAAGGPGPDVLLADPRMSAAGGIAQLQGLRARAPRRAPEIVLMSSDATQAEIEMARRAGIVAVLRKPFVWADLARAIEAAFAARSLRHDDSGHDVPC